MPNKKYFSEIELIKNDISLIKTQLHPDKLALTLDNSYLSINNLRGFLQILALIMSIFMAGAVGFGYLGVKNILDLNQEMNKMKELISDFSVMSKTAEDQFDLKINSINNIENSFNNSYNNLLSSQELSKKRSDSLFLNIKNDYSDLQNIFNNDFSLLDSNLSTINNQLKSLSDIFYKTSVKHQNILTSREQSLLMILSEIFYRTTNFQETNQGLFYYNLAVNFHNIKEYDLAITYFNHSLNLQPNLSQDKVQEIKSKIIQCTEKSIAKKSILKNIAGNSEVVSVNQMVDFDHVLLEDLVNNGYIKEIIAREILRKTYERLEN